jgi:MFS family permease
MRAIYVVVSSLVFTALVALGGAGAVIGGSTPAGWPSYMALGAIILLTLPPIALGAFVQWWPIEPWRGAGRRDLLRMVIVTVALQAIGAVLAAVTATQEVLPAWQAALYLTLIAVASVANIAVARAVRRREDLRPPAPGATWDRATVRRKSRTVALWFLGALLVAVAGVVLLEVLLPDRGEKGGLALSLLWLALSLAFIAASLACLVVAWPLVLQVREIKGRYFSEMRTIARVVVKGKKDSLTAEDEGRAARYARIMTVYYPFQIAQFTLLYLAILCQQLPRALAGDDLGLRPFSIGLSVFLVVAFLVTAPMMLRQWRRAKAYAATHADVVAG